MIFLDISQEVTETISILLLIIFLKVVTGTAKTVLKHIAFLKFSADESLVLLRQALSEALYTKTTDIVLIKNERCQTPQ